MTALLEAREVSRCYPMRGGMFGRRASVRAVDGVSLSLLRGQTLGLVGESGSGKSTAGRLLLGLEAPDEGAVFFDGGPMPPAGSQPWRALRRTMQMVFQDPLGALDRRLTIVEQIREPLEIHAVGTPQARAARAGELLAAVGLSPRQGDAYPGELSGGQRQRAVIARALALKPELLVCDEPVSALDVSIQAQVVNLLTDLQAELGLAILFISHDLRVVRQVCNDVAVMYLGRIVESGPVEQVFAAPQHPYTQGLLSAAPTIGVRRTTRVMLKGDPPDPAARPSGCAFHPRCPVAAARCAEEAPPVRHFGGGRMVTCHATAADGKA